MSRGFDAVAGGGVHFLAVIYIPFLNDEARLGAIPSFSASEGSVAQKTALHATYAAGLGNPFRLVAGVFPRLTGA